MEAIAFNFLMIISNILNVTDIPKNSDANWEVVKRWEKQVGGSYLLELKGDSSKICNSVGYLIFPQVYMGKISIYADDYMVFTNLVRGKWDLMTTLNREIVPCRYFNNSEKIRLTIESQTKYFSSIYRYPYLSPKFPIDQFLYKDLYLVSSVFCLFFGIVGFLLFRQLKSNSRSIVFLVYNLAFALLMLCHIGGTVGLDVSIAHVGVMVSLNIALVYFSIFSLGKEKNGYIHLIMIALSATLLVLCYERPNLTQSIIVIFTPIAIVSTFIVFIYILKKGTTLDKWLYLAILIFVCKDCYMSQAVREGFLYLSMIVVLISITGVVRVMEQVSAKSLEVKNIEIRLRNERKVIEKISSINDVHREIIHDLRSPLTALEFNLSKFNNEPIVLEVVSRLKAILSRINSEGIKKNFDWYSHNALEKMTHKIINEKAVNIGTTHSFDRDRSCEIYLDPLDFEICLSELLDNAIKYSIDVEKINIRFEDYADEFSVVVWNSAMLSNEKIGQIGERGISDEGSGLGLSGVRKKMQSMGGGLTISSSSEFLEVSMKFRKRLI